MNKSIMQSRSPLAAWCVLAIAALCAVLAGCNVGPKYLPPTATAPGAFKESPTQFKESDGWTVAQPQDAALRGKWWEIYNDAELNSLEDQLNIDNQNIRQAFENFMEARALVREARSQYFPTVSVGGSYTRSRTSSNVGSAAGTGTSGGRTDAGVFFSGRCVLGARSLGEGAQRGTRQPIYRPIDRGRS